MEAQAYKELYDCEDEHWWFTSLWSLAAAEIKKAAKGRIIHSLLDVGCGTGGWLRYATATLGLDTSIGVDGSSIALSYAKEKSAIPVTQGNALSLPFEDASFDAVTCIDVIGHYNVASEEAVLAELYRVLKPGGVLLLHHAAYSFLRSAHDAVVHFDRRYTRSELVHYAANAGFSVTRSSYRCCFLFPLILAARLGSILRPPQTTPEQSDVALPSPVVQRVLSAIMKLENAAQRIAPLPFGSSAYVVALKRS